MTTTATKPPMKRFEVLVSNGYRYEYEATIQATSAAGARKEWKLRGDWKSDDFRVRLAPPTASEIFLKSLGMDCNDDGR